MPRNPVEVCYKKFSKPYKQTKKDDSTTHFSLFRANYCIPLEVHDEHLERVGGLYEFGVPFGLVETRQGSPIFAMHADLDFRVIGGNIPVAAILEYIKTMQGVLQGLCPGNDKLDACVSFNDAPWEMRSTKISLVGAPLFDENEKHWDAELTKLMSTIPCRAAPHKQGCHVVWPDLLVDNRTALWIRMAWITTLSKFYPLYTAELSGSAAVQKNRWADIVDECIYTNNGLRMNGAQKTDICKACKKTRDQELRKRAKVIAGGGTYQYINLPICDVCNTNNGVIPIKGVYVLKYVLDKTGNPKPSVDVSKINGIEEIKMTSIRRPAAKTCDMTPVAVPDAWSEFVMKTYFSSQLHPSKAQRSKRKHEMSVIDGVVANSSASLHNNRFAEKDNEYELCGRRKAEMANLLNSIMDTPECQQLYPNGECRLASTASSIKIHKVRKTISATVNSKACLVKYTRQNLEDRNEMYHHGNRTHVTIKINHFNQTAVLEQGCFNTSCKNYLTTIKRGGVLAVKLSRDHFQEASDIFAAELRDRSKAQPPPPPTSAAVPKAKRTKREQTPSAPWSSSDLDQALLAMDMPVASGSSRTSSLHSMDAALFDEASRGSSSVARPAAAPPTTAHNFASNMEEEDLF